jgi:hypothetical protein
MHFMTGSTSRGWATAVVGLIGAFAAGCPGPKLVQNDPCVTVTCNSAPATACIDPNTLRTYASPGTCSEGQCTYASTDTTCPLGCDATLAACKTDPCEGVTCNMPPAQACADANNVQTWSNTGVCSGGKCSYSSSLQNCPFGCDMATGKCKADPCANVTCNMPPPSSCSDCYSMGASYVTPGTCSNGMCSYMPMVTQTCTYGCDSSTNSCYSGAAPGGNIVSTSTGMGDIRYKGKPAVTAMTVDNTQTNPITWSVVADDLSLQNGYETGSAAASTSQILAIPHDEPFTVTLSDPLHGLISWFFAKENDCGDLVSISMPSTQTAEQVSVGSGGTLINMAGFVTVTATGSLTATGCPSGWANCFGVTVNATGSNVVEETTDTGDSYNWIEVFNASPTVVLVPDQKTFTMILARPDSADIGAIHCAEAGGQIACVQGTMPSAGQDGGTSIGYGSGQTMLSVPGLATMTATTSMFIGNYSHGIVTIASSGPEVEWSYQAGGQFSLGGSGVAPNLSDHGIVPAGGMVQVTLPHYTPTVITLANTSMNLIGAVRCKENDGNWVCLSGDQFIPQ